MNLIDNNKVIELHNIPQSSVGAPMPVVLSDEHSIMLAYYTQEFDNEEETIAIIRFVRGLIFKFGPPNDEMFHGHHLYLKGLRPYSSYVIENSSWMTEVEKMNSVHPRHNSKLYEDYRHFIFSFHDSTFECIAVDYKFELINGSMSDAIEVMKDKFK